MANHQKALSWVLSSASTLKLKISNPKWIANVLPSWTDIYCSLSLGGETYNGWGADPSEDVALCKAVSEAIERAVARQNGIKISNGVASHFTFEMAAENAVSELRERDAFLCHFLLRTPFTEISPWGRNPEIEGAINSWLVANNLTIKFYLLSDTGALCIVRGSKAKFPFGIISGSAIKRDLVASAKAALIEVIRSVSYLLNGPKPPEKMTIDAFNLKGNYTFLDHGRLALDEHYANSINFLFEPSDSEGTGFTDSDAANPAAQVQLRPLALIDLKAAGCPFHIVRAESPNLQNLWLGPTHPKVVNFQRLSIFKKESVRWEELNLLPHPFD